MLQLLLRKMGGKKERGKTKTTSNYILKTLTVLDPTPFNCFQQKS